MTLINYCCLGKAFYVFFGQLWQKCQVIESIFSEIDVEMIESIYQAYLSECCIPATYGVKGTEGGKNPTNFIECGGCFECSSFLSPLCYQ